MGVDGGRGGRGKRVSSVGVQPSTPLMFAAVEPTSAIPALRTTPPRAGHGPSPPGLAVPVHCAPARQRIGPRAVSSPLTHPAIRPDTLIHSYPYILHTYRRTYIHTYIHTSAHGTYSQTPYYYPSIFFSLTSTRNANANANAHHTTPHHHLNTYTSHTHPPSPTPTPAASPKGAQRHAPPSTRTCLIAKLMRSTAGDVPEPLCPRPPDHPRPWAASCRFFLVPCPARPPPCEGTGARRGRGKASLGRLLSAARVTVPLGAHNQDTASPLQALHTHPGMRIMACHCCCVEAGRPCTPPIHASLRPG
ncbi:hypothetical protein PSV09DRAFT_2379810 [Bipolaris maydis]|nr:hypothetical protein PSV09DRAFT_2379810 [Bipolaris maydis]